MEFGSEFVFAPTAGKDECEAIPENQYNHVVKVTGYASHVYTADHEDDGEVGYKLIVKNQVECPD